MVTAHEFRTILKILNDADLLKEEPDFDVFVDLLDEINKECHENLKRIKEEMVEK